MSIPYFLDECTQWELNDIIENLPYTDRTLWEVGRLNAFVVALVNSKKTLKLQDICKFKWEEDEEVHNTTISNADVQRLKAKAEEIRKSFSKHKIN